MKTKTNILFFFCIVLSITLQAQDKELAKAYYKKAIEVLNKYEEIRDSDASSKIFPNVGVLIEKSEDALGGKMNPDLAYLKMKFLVINGLNKDFKEVLNLCNYFLDNASEIDERRENVLSIKVDVNTLCSFHENGIVKKCKAEIGNVGDYSNISLSKEIYNENGKLLYYSLFRPYVFVQDFFQYKDYRIETIHLKGFVDYLDYSLKLYKKEKEEESYMYINIMDEQEPIAPNDILQNHKFDSKKVSKLRYEWRDEKVEIKEVHFVTFYPLPEGFINKLEMEDKISFFNTFGFIKEVKGKDENGYSVHYKFSKEGKLISNE